MPLPKLHLTIGGGKGAREGATIRYRLGVRNKGSVAADRVRVRARLPRSLKHRRGGRLGSRGRTVVFSLGRLAPRRARSRLMIVRVGDDIDPDKRIVVRASVTGRTVSDED